MKKSTYKKIHPTDWVTKRIYESQNGYCGIEGCYNKIDDFHHIKSNSKENNIKWPLFIQSPQNLIGLCRKHHNSEVIYQFKISDKLADVYEDYLYSLKHGLLEE